MKARLLQEITTALTAAADPAFKERQQSYSKESILSLGVRTSTVRAIAKDFFPRVKRMPIDTFLTECEVLLIAGTLEHRAIAFAWAYRRRRELQRAHYKVLESWLQNFVSNWAACDQLCTEVFGAFMIQYPEYATRVLSWTHSENRWVRRAASVVLIPNLRQEATFYTVLMEVATALLTETDDLVQKGCGWALKEVMELRQDDTYRWVLDHKGQMPRTTLRYAIEKLSAAQKTEAMKS